MTPQELLRSRLIGTLFVERGLVSESQIRLALEIQEETDQQLGEILVERFGVSRAELAQVVAEQWQDNGRAAGPVLEASLDEKWRRIGEIFVTRGFVTVEQLEQALSRQRQTGERLGEALVSLGVISKFELAGALGEQMATVDESAPRPEARQAEVVELRTREPLELPRATEPPPADPVPADPAPADAAPVDPVPANPPVLVAAVEQAPEREPEPDHVEPRTADVVAAEVTPLSVVPDETWPEGEYVPPVRPQPTLGADLSPSAVEPALELHTAACVALLATPAGYRLVPLGHDVPDVGAAVEVEGHGRLVVVRRGRSPLPHDERPCLILEAPAHELLYSFA